MVMLLLIQHAFDDGRSWLQLEAGCPDAGRCLRQMEIADEVESGCNLAGNDIWREVSQKAAMRHV